MSEFRQKLVIDHADGAVYGKEGIRDQFVYRQFGVEEATGGKYGAHLIRGGDGPPPIEAHIHTDIDFLIVYVVSGWVTFWYEGHGEETLKAGSVHMLPPEIKHSVIEVVRRPRDARDHLAGRVRHPRADRRRAGSGRRLSAALPQPLPQAGGGKAGRSGRASPLSPAGERPG